MADLYGIETKRITKAVKNNPLKFPQGYLIMLNSGDKNELAENFDRFNKLKHATIFPKAFTEKGMYTLRTRVFGFYAIDFCYRKKQSLHKK